MHVYCTLSATLVPYYIVQSCYVYFLAPIDVQCMYGMHVHTVRSVTAIVVPVTPKVCVLALSV